jgi:hypothetical protein
MESLIIHNLKRYILKEKEMKLVFILDKPFIQNSVMPRDIRNLVGSLVKDEVLKNKLMNKDKEGNEQSVFIYPKPRPKTFEVLSYLSDIKALVAVENALVGESITINGNKVKIESCMWKEEEFVMPIKELNLYTTRTPIVVSINSVEHKMAHFVQNSKDDTKVAELLRKRILGLTKLQMKQHFKHDVSFDDLEIKIMNWNMRTVTPNRKERPDIYHQALYVDFVSNYTLPRFLGYQSGLGYGEILNTNFGNSKFKKGK